MLHVLPQVGLYIRSAQASTHTSTHTHKHAHTHVSTHAHTHVIFELLWLKQSEQLTNIYCIQGCNKRGGRGAQATPSFNVIGPRPIWALPLFTTLKTIRPPTLWCSGPTYTWAPPLFRSLEYRLWKKFALRAIISHPIFRSLKYRLPYGVTENWKRHYWQVSYNNYCCIKLLGL